MLPPMANRARDWLAQAERDLRHARGAQEAIAHARAILDFVRPQMA